MTKTPKLAILACGAAMLATAGTATAQDVDSTFGLRLPDNIVLFGDTLPPVIKATAIVNGEIITQTDIDQRVALTLIGSDGQLEPGELESLQQQVLRNLIDETLQIQAAKADEIEIDPADINRALERVAQNTNSDVEGLAEILASNGSSIRSIRRQIEGELAWQRLQQNKIARFVSVGDEEIDAVLEKLESSKGSTEYRVGEIFLASTPANDNEIRQRAASILDALRQGGSFVAFARQYSQASTAAVGGDLGWVRPEQLPEALGTALRQMDMPGAVSVPIKIPGGYSILALQDRRTILTADPRNSVMTLKQVSIPIDARFNEAQANAFVDRFAAAAADTSGCGSAEGLANEFGGSVVTQDNIRMRDLPPALQQMMVPMQVGQVTRPFGALDEAVRVLVICGREDPAVALPSRDQIERQKTDERVAMRAQRYLRDLRRDAIIDFR